MDPIPTATPPPVSLTGHTVPADRLEMIRPHIEALAKTALTVNDTIPLEADAADFIAALEEAAP